MVAAGFLIDTKKRRNFKPIIYIIYKFDCIDHQQPKTQTHTHILTISKRNHHEKTKHIIYTHIFVKINVIYIPQNQPKHPYTL